MKYLITVLLMIFIINSCSDNEFSVNKNVPDSKDFKNELSFELIKKFSYQNGKKQKLYWELLSNKPLEKQNEYPQYFVWIKMKDDNHQNQGLVKLITKDKTFHWIAFMNDKRIKVVPNEASKEFPPEILEKIKNK